MKQTKGKRTWFWVLRLLLGGGIGFLNGFFGSGGGVLAVGAMTRLGEEEKRAHASAILAILPLCVVSAACRPAWVNLLFTGLILLAGLRMLLF